MSLSLSLYIYIYMATSETDKTVVLPSGDTVTVRIDKTIGVKKDNTYRQKAEARMIKEHKQAMKDHILTFGLDGEKKPAKILF